MRLAALYAFMVLRGPGSTTQGAVKLMETACWGSVEMALTVILLTVRELA